MSEEQPTTAAGPWKCLYDDYDAGTVFVTRDPQRSQSPLVEGLTIEQGTAIAAALNEAEARQQDDSGLPDEPGDCECGLSMDAHCGGMSLLHHDDFQRHSAPYLREAITTFLERWDNPEVYHRLPAVDDLRTVLAAFPPNTPPAPADSWRDTGNRGAAEHRARLEPER